MKLKFFSLIAVAAMSLFGTTACMDDHDEPNTDNYSVTSSTDIGEVNATILEVKQKYCTDAKTADFKRNASNFYTEVNEDMIIEGVVVANDKGGNLYQTVMIRNIDDTKNSDDPNHDQSIIIGIKSSALYPYFALGQRLKINLKGLWAGVYSKVPRIGQPTKSSYGNMNLGPILFELCQTNIQLVGKPNPDAPELTPVDLSDVAGDAWIRASKNQTVANTPMLGTVCGMIKEVLPEERNVLEVGTTDKEAGKTESLSANGKKMFAPYELHDQGYGVDRTINLLSNNSHVTIRTSTKIDVSFLELPEDARSYTGVLTYYSGWQIQVRDTDDISAN